MKPAYLILAAAALMAGACNSEPAGNSGTAAPAPGGQAVAPPPGGDWTQTVSQTDAGGFIMGNPNATVKVVEFGSMTCPACAGFAAQGAENLINDYVKSGRVAFEFRNYVRDPLDITMALVARCGGPQRFFPLTDAMFEDQAQFFETARGSSPQQQQALAQQPPAQQFAGYAQLAGLQEWAALRGVPAAQQQQCLSNQAEIDRLVQMTADANSNYEISGTPSFLINDELVVMEAGKPLWEQLRAKIDERLN
jgi:protein-disulfide isomerase